MAPGLAFDVLTLQSESAVVGDEIPDDIEVIVEKPTLISVKGIDKQRVGQEAHKLRSERGDYNMAEEHMADARQKGARVLVGGERNRGLSG